MQPEEQSKSIYPEPVTPHMSPPDHNQGHGYSPPEVQVSGPVFSPHVASAPLMTPDQTDLTALANAQPVAVVKTLSTRGLEYLFMSIALWIAASGLIWALLLVVNGQTSAPMLGFPATSLIVCIPVFAYFFIRLKKAELKDPALRFDASKRRLSQITQTIAFLTCIFNVITFVYLLFSIASGSSLGQSVVKLILDLLVILAVAGGILVYYWADEHRSFKK